MMANIYESELLYKLMERDGLNVPSSVPPYESEIKAYLIEQVKLAYPKLTDYEAEWLLYNYTKHIPAEFPIESITNVTDATVNNVVPYAYKSAILTGDSESPFDRFEIGTYSAYDGTKLPKQNNTTRLRTKNTYSGVVGEFDFSVGDGYKLLIQIGYISDNVSITTEWVQSVRYTATTDKLFGVIIKKDDGSTLTLDDIKNSGFQTNYPILGELISVKMPVLTTIGKNVFDGKFIKYNSAYGQYHFGNGIYTYSITDNDISIDLSNVSFGDANNGSASINWLISNGNVQGNKRTITNRNLVFYPNNEETFNKIKQRYNIQIEQGSVATSYEPFKTNILTVNEDVTLRSNGSVHDELDLLTGKLTQRIDENGEVLSQEIVKTVNLSIVDESGNEITHFMPIEGTMHIQTDGTPIKPSVTMEIPVEAITQNLASFIKGE